MTDPAGSQYRPPLGRSVEVGAGRRVLAFYDGAPAMVRAHVRVRSLTCPLASVAVQVPRSGRVLDVGCGHGLLSLLLACDSAEREVLGVDVDPGKVAAANLAARVGGPTVNCSFELAPPGEVPDGPWAGVVIADVLYLLDADDQHGLLRSCAQRLAPGGVLVVKEMAPTPAWKAAWNRFQETVSVRLLGITAGDGRLVFLPPERLAGWLTEEGLEVTHRPLDRGYLHPHHLFVARRRA